MHWSYDATKKGLKKLLRIINENHIRPRRNAASMTAVKVNDKINTEHEVPKYRVNECGEYSRELIR